MPKQNRFFTIGVQLMLTILMLECANGSYIRKESSVSSDQIKTGVKIDGNEILAEVVEASSTLVNLMQELDQPRVLMSMATSAKDKDCPLSLCNHVKAIVLVPHRPRLFVVCLPDKHFCGLCPPGTTLQPHAHSFHCVPTVEDSKNETRDCDLENTCQTGPGLFLPVTNDSRSDHFVICSKRQSFCGFCPPEISTFNTTTFTCDLAFPETKFVCSGNSEIRVFPDPLSPCSPLAYICLPGKRNALTIRCPDPKMRQSHSQPGCHLPENVPECGGAVESAGNETSTQLS